MTVAIDYQIPNSCKRRRCFCWSTRPLHSEPLIAETYMTWLFHDEPDTGCFTTKLVLEGSPILRVYHEYDGDWQFHGDSSQSASEEDARLVCLTEMVSLDPSLQELHDLPCGWRAERLSTNGQWTRHKDHPFPTFEEHGYYLEDALWLAEFLPDIDPPDQDIRENLAVGQYVKLVFRFAAEDSDRQDNECERMWVVVTDQDDDGHYHGTLDNDPHHDAIECGDSLVFHPLHVAEIYDDE